MSDLNKTSGLPINTRGVIVLRSHGSWFWGHGSIRAWYNRNEQQIIYITLLTHVCDIIHLHLLQCLTHERRIFLNAQKQWTNQNPEAEQVLCASVYSSKFA